MEIKDKKSATYILQQFNFGKVEQFNNGVHTVNNYNGVDGESATRNQKAQEAEEEAPEEQRDLAAIHNEILDYVGKLNTYEYVYPEWKDRYRDLWDKILYISEVEAEVYNIGKQQDTSFNRSLVGKIINYLGHIKDEKKRVFKKYNATRFAYMLEKNSNKSIRGAMGNPLPREINKCLDNFMDEYVKEV